MQFGQKKTSLHSTMALIDHVFRGEVDKTIVQYTNRVAVLDPQAETTEYLNFSEMLRNLRKEGKLTWDKTDKTTMPSFSIHYPKEDNGNYFVVLNWCEIVVASRIDKVTE